MNGVAKQRGKSIIIEYREQRTEYRELSTEHGEQRTEYREQRTENRVQSTEHREQSTENRVQRTEYREQLPCGLLSINSDIGVQNLAPLRVYRYTENDEPPRIGSIGRRIHHRPKRKSAITPTLSTLNSKL